MTACLREEALVALATGDGDAPARQHLATCPACRARLAGLEHDLALLHGVLHAPPPPAPARTIWLPVGGAAAVTAALALLLLAPWRAPAPTAGAGEEATAEFAAALNAALFAAAGEADQADDDAELLAAALNGGGLCSGGYAGADCDDLLVTDY